MSTQKPKVLLIIDNELLERIEDYRYGNRIPSRNEAIRRLIIDSLDRHEKHDRESKE